MSHWASIQDHSPYNWTHPADTQKAGMGCISNNTCPLAACSSFHSSCKGRCTGKQEWKSSPMEWGLCLGSVLLPSSPLSGSDTSHWLDGSWRYCNGQFHPRSDQTEQYFWCPMRVEMELWNGVRKSLFKKLHGYKTGYPELNPALHINVKSFPGYIYRIFTMTYFEMYLLLSPSIDKYCQPSPSTHPNKYNHTKKTWVMD